MTLVVSEVFGPTVQGEGPSLGARAAFLRLGRCNLDCSWCFAPDTPVLMSDWSWRSIGALVAGDRVIGRTPPTNGRHGQLQVATVLATGRRTASLVDTGAFRCTPDHAVWLAGDRNHRSGWRPASSAGGAQATFLAAPAKVERASWALGWLAGMADGDGCFWTLQSRARRPYRRFRLALGEPVLLQRFQRHAHDLGYDLRWGTHRASGFGESATMDCLWLTIDAEARAFEEQLATDGDESWAWGYLGGILDAEGSLSANVLRVSQCPVANAPTWTRIERVLDRLALPYALERKGFRLLLAGGRLYEILTCAQPLKPSILRGGVGRAPNNRRAFPEARPSGDGEVVAISTDLGNYVASGYLVRNCDTPFTWNWEEYDPGVELTERPVEDVVEQIAAMGVDRVVVTGGEPMLQQRRLLPFLEAAAERGWTVEVETNGTLAPSADTARLVAHFNVSPKLANSGVPPERAIVPGALAALQATGKAAFKFVVGAVDELDEVQGVVDANHLEPVWIMPEGVTAEAVLRGGRALVDAVTARGWHLTTRLHVLLWGDERGR